MIIHSPGAYHKQQLRRMMVFADGKNMVFNYQSTLKNTDLKPSLGLRHLEDTYVWHPDSFNFSGYEVIRFIYYTFGIGDDTKIEEIKGQIKNLTYSKDKDSILPFYLRPSVFKKAKQGKKTKGVDIQMTEDILSNVYYDNVDTVLF